MLATRASSCPACHRNVPPRVQARPSNPHVLLSQPNWCRSPSEHGSGDASTSGSCSVGRPAARLVASAVADGYGGGDSQFSRFRSFQRQAGAAAAQGGQEQAAARGPAARGRGEPGVERRGPPGSQGRQPYSKMYWRQLPRAWFARPEYTPATLYEEIVRRCETNTCGVEPLYMMCKLAASPTEARIALNAFAAVRASLVRQGRVAPFSERLAGAFTGMIQAADAPDVLVESLRRATELGLLQSSTRLHGLLKHWGAQGELAKMEEVLAAMPLGGIPYSHITAYIVIRTAVNLGAMDKAEYYAAAMAERQIRLTPSAARLLELGRLRQRQQQAAAAAAAAEAARGAQSNGA